MREETVINAFYHGLPKYLQDKIRPNDFESLEKLRAQTDTHRKANETIYQAVQSVNEQSSLTVPHVKRLITDSIKTLEEKLLST